MEEENMKRLYIVVVASLVLSACLQSTTPQPATTPLTGKWETYSKTDSFTDKQIWFASLDAENTVTNGTTIEIPTLMIRCNDKELDVYISTGLYISGYSEYRLKWRFDQDEAVDRQLPLSDDGKAIFFKDSQEIIDTMLKKETLLIGFTPYNSAPTEATFNLGGLSEAIKPINESCK
jgi:type VI secretion system protein VasI